MTTNAPRYPDSDDDWLQHGEPDDGEVHMIPAQSVKPRKPPKTTTNDPYLLTLLQQYRAALAAQESAAGDEAAYLAACEALRLVEVAIAAYLAAVVEVSNSKGE